MMPLERSAPSRAAVSRRTPDAPWARLASFNAIISLPMGMGDRVIAIDANPDRGTLGLKVKSETAATIRTMLAEAPHILRYADARAFTSQSPARLEVLASDTDPAVSEAFNADDYRTVAGLIERYYSICITDCGTGLLHGAMGATLELADQIVLVSLVAVDGASSAAATLDWLTAHGYADLVKNAIVVLNAVEPKSDVDVELLERHFNSRCRAVIRIPYDPHLKEGAEVDLVRLRPTTRGAYLRLAAAAGQTFGQRPDRGQLVRPPPKIPNSTGIWVPTAPERGGCSSWSPRSWGRSCWRPGRGSSCGRSPTPHDLRRRTPSATSSARPALRLRGRGRLSRRVPPHRAGRGLGRRGRAGGGVDPGRRPGRAGGRPVRPARTARGRPRRAREAVAGVAGDPRPPRGRGASRRGGACGRQTIGVQWQARAKDQIQVSVLVQVTATKGVQDTDPPTPARTP